MVVNMVYKEIAIGILKRGDSVCLTLRQAHQSFSGDWEFPGGKVEQSESVTEALVREFQEELGVETSQWKPLITVPWQYDGFAVRLNVLMTDSFQGEPTGCEGQTVRWLSVSKLGEIKFPTANQGIVTALQLADQYMISGRFESGADALEHLKRAFVKGISFCQLRAKALPEEDFVRLANKAIPLAHQYGAKILLNGCPELLNDLPEADGIQLASTAIFDYEVRPIASDKLLGVSTHNREEITQALKIGADFILLSPVKETESHPGIAGMGWLAFSDLVKEIPVPVFALGGMKSEDLILAKQAGAQGIAAISNFWPAN